MNTFLPFPDYEKSARCLDSRRLRKQQVECKQIVEILNGKGSGWAHHPAVLMWVGQSNALISYAAEIASECARRGFSTASYMATQAYYDVTKDLGEPWWLRTVDFHYAYQSKLMFKGRKDVLELRIREYMKPPSMIGCRSVGAWLRQSGQPQLNMMNHGEVAVMEGLMNAKGVPNFENHYAKWFAGVRDDVPYFWPGAMEKEELYAAP
jgi:hypothetical protein